MFFLIEQTNVCNLHCVCCPNRFHERPTGYMSNFMLRKIIDQLIAHDPAVVRTRVALHGYGEPILSPYFFENLRTLEDAGFTNVDFSSNGVHFTPEIASQLINFKCLSWVRISLNSSRRDLMERINTGTNFDLVVENIRELLSSKTKPFTVVVQLMRTKQNPTECPADYFQLFGRSDFEVLEKVLDTLGSQIPYSLVEDLAFPGKVQSGCAFANNSIYIHWDGDLVGCCLDNTKSQVYGNVSDGIFSEKVDAQKQYLREKFALADFSELPLCSKCIEGSS